MWTQPPVIKHSLNICQIIDHQHATYRMSLLETMHLTDSKILETEKEYIRAQWILGKLKGVIIGPNPGEGRQDLLLLLQNSLAKKKEWG